MAGTAARDHDDVAVGAVQALCERFFALMPPVGAVPEAEPVAAADGPSEPGPLLSGVVRLEKPRPPNGGRAGGATGVPRGWLAAAAGRCPPGGRGGRAGGGQAVGGSSSGRTSRCSRPALDRWLRPTRHWWRAAERCRSAAEGFSVGSDEHAIRTVQAAWFEATAAGDLARLRTLMADDVVFLAPSRPPFGAAEFASAFEAGQRQVRISCVGELEEVVVAGDVAYTRGRLAVTILPLLGGVARRMSGYTLSVFRRQPDGRWVLARDANLLSPESA